MGISDFITSVLLNYTYVFILYPNETKNGQQYFNCDIINGLAATRATKMVLVTVPRPFVILSTLTQIIFSYNYIHVIFNSTSCHVTALMKYYLIIW